MKRRTFVRAAGLSALAAHLSPGELRAVGEAAAPPPDPTAFIMDAMGELRTIYDPPLIREMLGAGMDAITVTLGDPRPTGCEALEIAVDALNEHRRYLDAHPDLFVPATSVADIDEAIRSGRLAVFYLYQNTVQFGDDLDRVNMFYDLGVRSAQLTYNSQNLSGWGVEAESDDQGLTDFGRRMIYRMNDVGMLLDLSHADRQTMADAIQHSRVPVVISHTGAESVHHHIRNTTDENMRLLADNGGVVGMCQIRPFITDLKEDNFSTYFDHVDHAVDVAGIDHVGIGSDRDHRFIEMTPEYVAELRAELGGVADEVLPYFIEGLNGPRRMERIWDELVRRGYSEDEVEKIMGGNLYRLYSEVIG